MSTVTYTPNDTLKLLSDIAKERGDGQFRARIRRRNGGAIPESVAIFDNATVDHFALPEAWLGVLAGGGEYLITAMHGQSVIGSDLTHKVYGEPRDVNTDVVKDTAWKGPPDLFWCPDKKAQAATPVAPQGTASRVADTVMPAAPPTAVGLPPPDLTAALTMKAGQLQDHERNLNVKATELALAQQKLEHEARIREMELRNREREMAALAAQPKSEKSVLSDLVPLLGSALALWMEANKESNKRAEAAEERRAQMQREQAQRDAEARKEALLLQQQAADRMATIQAENQKMLLALLNKPPENPSNALDKVFAPMVEAMGRMAQTTMQTVAAMSELQQPAPQGSTGAEIARDIAKAVGDTVVALAKINEGKGKPAPVQAKVTATEQPKLPQQAQVQQPTQGQPQQPAQTTQPSEGEQMRAIIAALVKNKEKPEVVANKFYEAFDNSDEFAALVEKADDLQSLFAPDLAEWVGANMDAVPYLLEIDSVLTKMGQERAAEQAKEEAAEKGKEPAQAPQNA